MGGIDTLRMEWNGKDYEIDRIVKRTRGKRAW